MKTPFFGASSVSRSTNLADNRCINIYPSVVDTKDGKDIGAFFATPGLDLLQTVGTGPIRGLQAMNNVLYVASGNEAYAVDSSYNVTSLGALWTSLGPVTMINNGKQLLLADGQKAYLLEPSFSIISIPFPNPQFASYQDGFGLLNQGGTNVMWQSNEGDLGTWNALTFSSADAQPTPIQAMIQIHREQWIFKNTGIEIWIDAGLVNFAFQRLQGVYIEMGTIASWSVVVIGEQIMFLGQDDEGSYEFWETQGYGAPRKVSTTELTQALEKYPTVTDAIAYSYRSGGHLFYVCTFPTADVTWTYDATESAKLGVPLWHQRAAFSNGQFHQHQCQTHCFFNNIHVVGDSTSGNIYQLDNNAQTDAGQQRKWLRSWRAFPKAIDEPIRFSELQIDMQTGILVPAGTKPLCVLRWSDDGGNTWSNEKFARVGPPGKTRQRVIFRRLGSTDRSSGLDRIFELSSSDQFDVCLIGANLT